MKVGDNVFCPFHSITHLINSSLFENETLFNIVNVKGKDYLRTEVSEYDLNRPTQDILLKFKLFCAGLSVATVGHFWVEDKLLDSNLRVILGEQTALVLLKGKELPDSGPSDLRVEQFGWGKQLVGWISSQYPHVFMYYSLGLFLLRVPSLENVYPEALLNFFKIVEIVTYTRSKKNAQLNVILSEAKSLDIKALNKTEIKKYYKVRGRDAAHDWGKTEPVEREDVINCKHVADEFIIADRKERINKVKRP